MPVAPRSRLGLNVAAFGLVVLLGLVSGATAHPVPKDTHDRTIVVRLQKGDTPDEAVVRVEYRLEVDELTVLLDDMKPFEDDVNLFDYRGRELDYYAEFAKLYAPIYAGNLLAKANGKPLEFTCTARDARLRDEKNEPLGHLRCDFVFQARFPLAAETNTVELRENNYLLQAGQVTLSLVNETGRPLDASWQPDEAFRTRTQEKPEPDDDAKLRLVSATLGPAAVPVALPAAPTTEPHAPRPPDDHGDPYSLLRLFLHSDAGFWLTMLMALVFGAAHALTPGHGKTLVAAYLVGERGTVWHALALGTVTTLTHTGMVLLVAAVLFFLPPGPRQQFATLIQNGLGLLMGLLVTGMGFWLLLQRLAGRADHFHVGGGHHHHHHGPGHTHTHEPAPPRAVTWWGLIVLGVTGGLVPCWDAIYLLLYTVGRSQFWIALPALVAFSAGLAGVLVLIGVLVVQVPRFAHSRWGHGRIVRALPIVSALVVTLMGVWLCYEGVHGR